MSVATLGVKVNVLWGGTEVALMRIMVADCGLLCRPASPPPSRASPNHVMMEAQYPA